MMSTEERAPRSPAPITRNSRWLIVSTVLLLLAVVAMGTWFLVDRYTTNDAEQLVVDYNAAWGDFDTEALRELITDDFRMVDAWAGETYLATRMDEALAGFRSAGFEVVESGDLITWGDWVFEPQKAEFFGGANEFEGISAFRIEDSLIAEHIAAFSKTK